LDHEFLHLEIEAHTGARNEHLTCIPTGIIKGTEFSTISEFRRFGLATRRGFASASISAPNVFTFGRRDAKHSRWQARWGGCGGQGRTEHRQRSETKRGKIREGGTLDPLLGCLPHTADPDAAPANPRRAERALINVLRVCW